MREAPNLAEVIAVIKDLAPELTKLGVLSLSLFGSVVVGDATPESDVDVAVRTIDPADVLIDADVRDLLSAKLGRPVDVAPLPLPPRLSAVVQDDIVAVL